jgi:hypothetical protein
MQSHSVPCHIAVPALAERAGWKKAVLALVGAVTLAATSGCVIAPAPYYEERRPPPPPVVYVEPAYPSPGVGWVWIFEPRLGWGWHHRERGRHGGGGHGRGRH